METMRDQVEKGFSGLKDFYQKKTDDLSARIDVFQNLEAKIDQTASEIGKQKQIHDDYKKKVIVQFNDMKELISKGDIDHKDFVLEYRANKQKEQFAIDDTKGIMTKVDNDVKNLRAYMETRVEGLELDITRRFRIDDAR